MLGVDDPIEASSVHGFTGIWGIIAVGLFHNELGLFSSAEDGKSKFFMIQLAGMTAIILWVGALSLIFFFIMNKYKLLRVSLLNEVIGLDIAEMGSHIHISKQVQDRIRSESIKSLDMKRMAD